MKRVACLIDGFNLYHAIHNNHPSHCKWCNYRKLIGHFLDPDDVLERVVYFTAHAKWDIGKFARHTLFIKALQQCGIEVILGRFKKKNLRCRKCFQLYKTHEEKESDVNIAVTLVSMAYEDAFDKVLLVSGDSDFVSTINHLKAKFPAKRVGVIVPCDPKRANDLRSSAHFSKAIERQHLLASRLPDELVGEDGSKIVCPPEYRTSTS